MVIVKTGSTINDMDILGYADSKREAKDYLFHCNYKSTKHDNIYIDKFGYYAQIIDVQSLYEVENCL